MVSPPSVNNRPPQFADDEVRKITVGITVHRKFPQVHVSVGVQFYTDAPARLPPEASLSVTGWG
jgi:hypothetical protein